jgi:hypothetical protein
MLILIIAAAFCLSAAIGRYRDGLRDSKSATLLMVGVVMLGFAAEGIAGMSWHQLQAIAPLLIVVTSFVIVVQLIRTPATSEDRCEQCGYLLQGLRAGRCPECGIDIVHGLRKIRRRRAVTFGWTSVFLWVVTIGLCQVVPEYTRWQHHVVFGDLEGMGQLVVGAETRQWTRRMSSTGTPTARPRSFEIRIVPLTEDRQAGSETDTMLTRTAATDEAIARIVQTTWPEAPGEITDRIVATISACIAADCRNQATLDASIASGRLYVYGGFGFGGGRVFESYLLVIAAAALLWILIAARFGSRLVRSAGV